MQTVTRLATLSLVASVALSVSCGTNQKSDQVGQTVSADTPNQQQGLECKFKPTSEMQEGLNLYKVAPGDELCGGFREGDHSISFQTLRGEDLVLGENDADFGVSSPEVSVRFIDIGGHSFSMALGHDERNASWYEPMSELTDEYNGEQRETDMILMGKAVSALKKLALGDFAEELKVLELQSDSMARNKAEFEQELLNLKMTESGRAQTHDGHAKAATRYTRWIQIKKKPAVYDSSIFDHSSVRFRIMNTATNATVLEVVTRNHGNVWANDPSMSVHCQKLSDTYTDLSSRITQSPCDDAGSGYGISKGKHVCNNDTYVQYFQAYYGQTLTSSCFTYAQVYAPTPTGCSR